MEKIKLSNRTKGHKEYIPRLDKKYIEYMCDYLGYSGYLPEVLLHDLINVYTYLELGEDINMALEDDIEFNIKEFLLSLPFSFFVGNTPIELAIDTLKQLTLEYNLRSLNNGNIERLHDISENSLFTLDDRDEVIFPDKTLDIDYDKIIKLGVKLTKELKLKVKSSGDVNIQMSSYSDVIKVRKSKLLRPDFKIKLATKSFGIKGYFQEEIEDVLIFIEDCSESMVKGDGFNLVKSLQREMVNDIRKIHYYKHFGYSIEYKELDSRESKLEHFSKVHTPHNYILDFDIVFKELYKYKKGDIVIVTDGKDFLPSYEGNLKLNFICLEGDNRINNICKSSGGKMIII